MQKSIKFYLPYSDSSEDKISINYFEGRPDILIKQEKDSILIDRQDINWLISALQEIKKFKN